MGTLPKTVLGDGLTVSAIGFGGMALTAVYGAVDDAESLATLHHCLDVGMTFIDTANVYGVGANETTDRPAAGRSPRRGPAGDEVRHRRRPDTGQAQGPRRRRRMCGSASTTACAGSSTDIVDLYYMHRRDVSVPIEETVGAMAELVTAGKVRHLGLSEVTADELRAAVAVHPIAAVQSEWSIWSRDVERNVVPAAAELGVGFVPYSPLGRGFLAGAIRSAADLSSGGDLRSHMPRFAGEALDANLAVVQVVTVDRRRGRRDTGAGGAGLAAAARRDARHGVGADPRHPARRPGRRERRVAGGAAQSRSDDGAGDRGRRGVRPPIDRPGLGVGGRASDASWRGRNDPMIDIILLGTGSPMVDPNRAGPSTLVKAGDAAFLVDCGRGVLMRAAAAGVGAANHHRAAADPSAQRPHHRPVRRHHHPWVTTFVPTPLPIIGPPGTKAVVRGDPGSARARHLLPHRPSRRHHRAAVD